MWVWCVGGMTLPFCTHAAMSALLSSLVWLFRYPRSILVDPTPSFWEKAWPAVDGGRDQTCPTEQRYTNCQLVRFLLVATLSVFTVRVHVAPCACTSVYCHTPIYVCIHVYTKDPPLNLLCPILVCVAIHLMQGPLLDLLLPLSLPM